MINAVSTLVETKKVLGTPESWCQYNMGATKDGEMCGLVDPKCKKRCLSGALYTAAHGGKDVKSWLDYSAEYHEARGILNKVLKAKNGFSRGLANYNDLDDTTYDDIISIIDEAIEYAKEAEKE